MKKVPWGTMILVFLVVSGLYTAYPTNSAQNSGSGAIALLYATGIIVGLGALVLCWFLFKPTKKDKERKEKPKADEVVKKATETPKSTPRNISLPVKFIGALSLCTLIFFLYAYNLAHISELATSVKNGCLYIPTLGLLLAGAIMVLTTVLASFNVWWVEIPAWVLFFTALVAGMWNHWFMPHAGDLIVNGWYVLFGVFCGLFIALLCIDDDDTQTVSIIVFIFTMVAVWFPQFVLWV